LNFPGKDEKSEPFQLEFQRYQRIEGILPLPEGVQVKNVQARVLENGMLRAQQAANLER
jgi:HSP20 family molecular chaperone IbpA